MGRKTSINLNCESLELAEELAQALITYLQDFEDKDYNKMLQIGDPIIGRHGAISISVNRKEPEDGE
jgi:hypothetical protein